MSAEPYHIPMSRWCEHANDRIAELEAERDKYKWQLDECAKDREEWRLAAKLWRENALQYLTDTECAAQMYALQVQNVLLVDELERLRAADRQGRGG